MLLLVYALLALVPLLGVVWVVLLGLIFTVDGLFLALICLTISGIFGTTALFELRGNRAALAGFQGRGRSSGSAVLRASVGPGGSRVEQGRVESVQFYESAIGQPNTSLVTLSDGGGPARTLVLDGDVRNALPVGKRVKIVCRDQAGRNVLADVSYA